MQAIAELKVIRCRVTNYNDDLCKAFGDKKCRTGVYSVLTENAPITYGRPFGVPA